ncbi:MAG TPA: GDSL-type esterase/lipase family protein [Planctomycetota bacterium]|jgi:lysophospholipase L1-like esterase|nr:GDSL-type esterase/lipase family protein [Planctomycetota bacterium]
MRSGRRALTRLAVFLLALLLAALAVEAAVSLFDPFGVLDGFDMERYQNELVELLPGSPRIFRHRPDRELRFRRWSIRTNADGLRGPERQKPKPPDVKRVLFVGDSVVFGWGVNEEDTFVALVEAALARRGRYECVNLGHLFHDTTQEAAAFADVGLAYEPDLVLLVFVDNDVVPTQEYYGGAATRPAATEAARRAIRRLERLAKLRPLLPRTHALLSYLFVQATPEAQTGAVEQWKALGLDLEKGWALAREGIVRMRDLSAARGARFAVLDLYRFAELEKFCAAQGIPYASIDFTAEERATGVRNSASDAHANPNGHRLYARHILDAIGRLRLLE